MINGHGGNIYALAKAHGCRPSDIVDMSANVNPLGPMPELVSYLKDQLIPLMAALPEADAAEMIRAYGKAIGIEAARIVAGNGSTELIHLIPRALEARSVVIAGPTYSDYQDACAAHPVSCNVILARESDGFLPDLQALQKAAANADLVFFCNPNNPTGVLTDRKSLMDLCQSCPDTVFVMDESYLPFAADPDAVSLTRANLPNALVMTSMSKVFRIPGLRIGFVIGPPALIAKLARHAMPWSVNSLAQAAVNWLMARPAEVSEFLAATRKMVESEKQKMIHRLHTETPIRCFPSAAPFILMRLPEPLTAQTVWAHMAGHRILIRNCANFSGLDDRFIRLSVKHAPENHRAAEQLAAVCSKKK